MIDRMWSSFLDRSIMSAEQPPCGQVASETESQLRMWLPATQSAVSAVRTP